MVPVRAKLCAVVVWFHPTAEYARNIFSYSAFVDTVIVIDNSPVQNQGLMPNSGNLVYLWDGENKGVAKALNIGCKRACEIGATWILTMDQDSTFDEADIRRHVEYVGCADDDVAILSPGFDSVVVPAGEVAECDSAITSGSLVRASAFLRLGGYNEGLFLDEVDHEFGYRLRRKGYRVLRVGGVYMNHKLGEPIRKRFLWRHIRSTNHGHLRKYYMTRSRLYMRKHFGEFGCPYLRMIMVDALKVMLIEKQKTLKLLFMLRGVVDHFRGVKGRLNQ
jgi:rhamnosyltransferase